MTATCGGRGDSPGRGPGRRIQYGYPTDGEDPEGGFIAVLAPFHSQWYGVVGVVMGLFPIPALRQKSP